MDDFGSGYSSLNMLSTLPVDALKLDMQFIRTAFMDRKDTRLLEAMIQLAEAFEVPTIAEGVETAEQVFTLKAMGCDIIQGYYFSRPLPASDFERFLLDHQPGASDVFLNTKRSRRDRFTYGHSSRQLSSGQPRSALFSPASHPYTVDSAEAWKSASS